MRRFPMRDMGELKWFLEIRIIWDRTQRKLWMFQDSYIKKDYQSLSSGRR